MREYVAVNYKLYYILCINHKAFLLNYNSRLLDDTTGYDKTTTIMS